jgi:hypothetical protein
MPKCVLTVEQNRVRSVDDEDIACPFPDCFDLIEELLSFS